MTDLRERFRAADQILVDEMLTSVRQRLAEASREGDGELRPVTTVRPRIGSSREAIRKVVTIAAVLVLATASIVVVVKTFRRSEPVTPTDDAGSVVATIPFTSGLRAIAAGEGAIWVASVQDGTISRIDPLTNEVVATIPVSSNEEGPWDVAAGEGGVWAITGPQAHPSQVVRIDPATNEVVAHIDVHDAAILEAGLGSVWVGVFNGGGDPGSLARIDPAANEVVAMIPVDPEPQSIAIGAGSVWVLDDLRYTITEVDPATETGHTVFRAATGAAGIVFEAGAVWTVECERTGPPVQEPQPGPGCDYQLVRVDAGTLAATSTHVATEREDAGNTLHNINTAAVAAGGGSVWVTLVDAPPVVDGTQTFTHGRVIQVEASTGAIVGTIDIGADYVGDAVMSDGSLWGSTWGASGEAAVLRIDQEPFPTG